MVVMLMVKLFPALLLPVLTLLTGVRSLRTKEMYVRTGEMVVLQCPHYIGHNPSDDAKLVWTSYTTQEIIVIDSISAEQRQILFHGRNLVILIASVKHQGNYSCSLGNVSSQFWFRLTVYTTQSTENEEKNKFSTVCYTQESCSLMCPEVNIPDLNTLNISSCTNFVWHKENESLPNDGYFSSVEKKDQGVYTCTRSYLYHGQRYNMTFTVVLQVQHNGKRRKSMILSPSKPDVYSVDLGSRMVIDCKAVVYSVFDELFWLSDTSFVEMNDSFPVFYTYHARQDSTGEINMTASLVFKNVSEKDLSRRYTCKLDSASELSSFVTITLAPKAHHFLFHLALGIVGILVVIVVIVVFASFYKRRCHKSIVGQDDFFI